MDSFQRHWQNPFSHTSLPRADEPVKAKPVGDAHDAPMGIYLSNTAAQTIDALLHDNPRHPWRGLLVGYAAQGSTRQYILVVGVIVVPTAAAGSGFHVSTPSYDTLRDMWQRDHPGTVVVGWFRTYPGSGVELSADDRFTHHTFFPQRWHTAFIIDPVRASSVFYITREGQPVPVGAFYLWDPKDDVRLLAALQQQTERAVGGIAGVTAAAAGRIKRKKRARLMPLALLSVLILLLALWRGLPGGQKKLPAATEDLPVSQTEMQQTAAAQLHSQNKTAGTDAITEAPSEQRPHEDDVKQNGQKHDTAAENEVVAAPPAGPKSTGTAEGATEAVVHDTTVSALVVAKSDPPLGTVNSPKTLAPPRELGTAYTVAPGDTLWDISQRLLGDPTNYKNIAESNAIPNPDVIFPGMSLQLHKTPLHADHDDDAQATESD